MSRLWLLLVALVLVAHAGCGCDAERESRASESSPGPRVGEYYVYETTWAYQGTRGHLAVHIGLLEEGGLLMVASWRDINWEQRQLWFGTGGWGVENDYFAITHVRWTPIGPSFRFPLGRWQSELRSDGVKRLVLESALEVDQDFVFTQVSIATGPPTEGSLRPGDSAASPSPAPLDTEHLLGEYIMDPLESSVVTPLGAKQARVTARMVVAEMTYSGTALVELLESGDTYEVVFDGEWKVRGTRLRFVGNQTYEEGVMWQPVVPKLIDVERPADGGVVLRFGEARTYRKSH